MRHAKEKGVMDTARSSAAGEAVREGFLDHLLLLGGGSVPGEFLRLQGLIPSALVARGLLRLGPGRWSDSYIAGPRLQPSPLHQPTEIAA